MLQPAVKIYFVLIACLTGYFGPAAILGEELTDSTTSPVLSVASSPKSASPEANLFKPSLDDGTTWRKNSTKFNKSRFGVLLGAIAIGDAIGFKKIADLQYNTETSSFHFHDWDRDHREYKQMDKIGHVVEAYHMSYLASKAYRWTGLSAKKSIFWGSMTGFLWMLQIEITDGFFKAWGFSYLDFTANIIGVTYSALQQMHPNTLKGIRFKFSFWPSEAYKNKEYSTVSQSILDDYEGFTWWLAFNFYDLMPQKWKQSYPGWLSPFGLAIGHGVEDIAQSVFRGKRELFIGLDFDITKIPTGDSNFLKFLKDELNFVRLPLPAVRLTPSGIWYGFYF